MGKKSQFIFKIVESFKKKKAISNFNSLSAHCVQGTHFALQEGSIIFFVIWEAQRTEKILLWLWQVSLSNTHIAHQYLLINKNNFALNREPFLMTTEIQNMPP